MGGSYVVARGELLLGADESEFALDGGFVGGYIAAAHGDSYGEAEQCLPGVPNARPTLKPRFRQRNRRELHPRERNPPIAHNFSFVLSPSIAYGLHKMSAIFDTNVYHHEYSQTLSE